MRIPGGTVGISAFVKQSPETTASNKSACSGYPDTVASSTHSSSNNSVLKEAGHTVGRISSRGRRLSPGSTLHPVPEPRLDHLLRPRTLRTHKPAGQPTQTASWPTWSVRVEAVEEERLRISFLSPWHGHRIFRLALRDFSNCPFHPEHTAARMCAAHSSWAPTCTDFLEQCCVLRVGTRTSRVSNSNVVTLGILRM